MLVYYYYLAYSVDYLTGNRQPMKASLFKLLEKDAPCQLSADEATWLRGYIRGQDEVIKDQANKIKYLELIKGLSK